MAPVTNEMLMARREEHCDTITEERKYYTVDRSFVKRSLRPREWQHYHTGAALHIPRLGNQRILNEGAVLRYIAANTDVPVPQLYACFEDDGAAYLIVEHVEGVQLAKLPLEQRQIVEKELEGYLATLRSLQSDTWGGPSGIVVPPYRVLVNSPRPSWKMKPRPSKDLVFCHNDFSAHNVLVDPITLTVTAIVDWEYADFYLPQFEGMFFRRPRPSVALEGEVNDEESLLEVMYANEAID